MPPLPAARLLDDVTHSEAKTGFLTGLAFGLAAGVAIVAVTVATGGAALAVVAAVGTGVAVDGRLLVPTAAGIAVLDWETGETLRDIPVDRGGYAGPISLNVAGDHVIEKRGTQLVSLRTA